MLAPDPTDAINQLTGILNATNGITQWVSALDNAVLQQLTPQQSWFDEINGALQASQQHSQTWMNETAPDIVDDMTHSFIHYSASFANVVRDLAPALAQIAAQNNLPTPVQVQLLATYITALQQDATANRNAVSKLLTAMQTYHTQMRADCAALKTALGAALPQEANERALVQQVQTQIQSIELTLAADNTQVTADDVNTNQAMSGLVVSLVFSLGTIDPVSFGIALLGIGIGIVIAAEDEARIENDLAQIKKLSAQLTTDQQQLGLLQGVVSNLESLSAVNGAALQTFDDFDDTWAVAVYGLTYLLVVLAQPQIDISKIPDLNDLNAAAAAWSQIAAFASKVQSASLVQQAPVSISPA
jgi:Bacillus haemolytic enterotoxin (HBL)